MTDSNTACTAARFDKSGLICWLVCLLPMTIALAWMARRIEAHFAPVLLFPLLVGASLGAASLGLARVFRFDHRLATIAATALTGLLLVGGMHYFAYRGYRHAFQQQLEEHPQALLLSQATSELGPKSFPGFLQAQAVRGRQLGRWTLSGRMVWAMWCVDAAAIVVAAGAVTSWGGSRAPGDRCDKENGGLRPQSS